MVKKGLISSEELQELLDGQQPTETEAASPRRIATPWKKSKDQRHTFRENKGKGTLKDNLSQPSSLEITIYRRAVQEIAPEIETQIDEFINETRNQRKT